MRFNGAIFDVDGVLVDSPHERAWRDSLQRLMDGPWREIASLTSYAPERFTTEVYQSYVAGKPREAGARAALEYFGVPDLDGRLLAEYCDFKQTMLLELIERGQFVAFDDALGFLLDLKAAGVRIGAASSSKNANIFLQKVPLARFADSGLYPFLTPDATLLEMFDANVCGRDFAHGKPAPDIFLAAAAELALPPAQCVVIEDASSGVQAAKAGGMACVGIARLDDQALLQAAGADWVVT
ncbi:MAG TPA: HAD-IA family hydrolase, partial [Roseiflexaceae bacterium]|nr:HAD-IA family hydrolase [Roseiflexaceae bacterium]